MAVIILVAGAALWLTISDGALRGNNFLLLQVPAPKNTPPGGSIGTSPMLGVQVDDLTEDVLQDLGLKPDVKGLIVTKVDAGPAAKAGLRTGDVIEQINHQPVNSMSDYLRLIVQAGKQTIQLLINRRGEKKSLSVQPG